jgi:hypothetical protein
MLIIWHAWLTRTSQAPALPGPVQAVGRPKVQALLQKFKRLLVALLTIICF